MTVEDRSFEVAEPLRPFSLADTAAVEEPFKRYRYDIEAIALFGFRVYMAICDGQFERPRDRKKAIMRAVLQRDVAAYLEGR